MLAAVANIETDLYLNMVDTGWLPILRLHYLNILNMVDAGWLPILRLTLT
jgi:hypothetical protein